MPKFLKVTDFNDKQRIINMDLILTIQEDGPYRCITLVVDSHPDIMVKESMEELFERM